MSSLAETLLAAAVRASGSVVADRRDTVPLADILQRAAGVGRDVGRVASCPAPVVAVVLPASVDAVTHLLAAILADHTVSFLDPADPQRTDAALGAVDPDVVVDVAGIHARRRRRQEPWAPGYVAMSSGTTGGAPKGVVTTWECLAEFVPHAAAALQVEAAARWAEPNHPTYDLAITNWLVALAAGASLHVSGALADRLRPLGMAARTGATHVRLAPRYVDLAVAERHRGTPCAVRVWASGGDRLSVEHAERVLALGVSALVNTYGTSETAGFASSATYRSASELRISDGAVSIGEGRVGPWQVELRPEVVQGVTAQVLAVSSPHLGGGYVFGGHGHGYPRWEPGRAVTGDLGSRVGSGLFCIGRAGRLVKRRASFVNLDDVDAAVRAHRGVASCTVATRGGVLVTLVEGEPEGLAGLRDALTTILGPDVLPDELVGVRRLPRLGNGKVNQAGAHELAESILQPAAVAGPGR
jgi:acyl-coenzyme A synthetase/AMP-(fatty) acid ligase